MRKQTGNDKLFNPLDYSKEMIAFASLVYNMTTAFYYKTNKNGKITGNKSLSAAVTMGYRTRAWFEIRYFSNNLNNGTNRRGWAHRKCKEMSLPLNDNLKVIDCNNYLTLNGILA